MLERRRSALLCALFCVCALLLFSNVSVLAEEIRRRDDAPQPLPPEKSIEHFRLPAGLKMELVASEPLVEDPSAIVFDARGRLFVCELHGYNLEGHLDVQELNKQGVLDQEVRRIPASDEARAAASSQAQGTVKLLSDTNGDGRMDRAAVWANDLPPTFGLVPARDGVIVVCRPDILFLADRDGDGRAETRQTLFTGFAETPFERSMNNPRWGLDGWIYVAGGNAGGHITGPNLVQPVDMGAADFRFKVDGSAIEPVTGRNGTFGQTFDDWGDRFVIDTRHPAKYAAPLPHRYLLRNPFVALPGTTATASNYIESYPASRPHPWRLERSQKAEWARYYSDRYGDAEATANGYFTSLCGPMIYRAQTLPEQYWGNLFACEPSQNLVHRCLLERDNVGIRARRAPGEERSEFLTSTDQWFRPTNLTTGPDGAIYIVDMYREIIEDYSAIPRYLQQQYGLIEGSRHGRLWRIVAEDDRTETPSFDLTMVEPDELVNYLSHTNSWWRQTARRLLVECGEKSIVPTIASIVVDGRQPQSRLQALATLQELNALDARVVEAALQNEHFAVRRFALRCSEPFLNENAEILATVLDRVDDPDANVRLQLALTLGETDDPRAVEKLARLATRDADDEWTRVAILSSTSDSSLQLLSAIVAMQTELRGEADRLIAPLAESIGARRDEQLLGEMLVLLASLNLTTIADQQTSLEGLNAGLQSGKPIRLTSKAAREALLSLLASESAEVRLLALRTSGLTGLADLVEMQQLFAASLETALDDEQSLDNRLAAVRLLSSATLEQTGPLADELLNVQTPAQLQLAVVQTIAASDSPEVSRRLLANWKTLTPQVQSAVLSAVFGRTNRLPGVLDALEAGLVSPASLGAFERIQLLEHADKKIRKRAETLLAGAMDAASAERIQQYLAALENERDVAHGLVVYRKVCATCHRLGEIGNAVGPDLSAVQNRSNVAFLMDILQPSSKITAGYRTYIVVDTGGRVVTGVLSAESATSVTLRQPPNLAEAGGEQQVERTILRHEIEAMTASDKSLMPEDIVKQASPQDLADVIAFLRERLGAPQSPSLVLFDDDSQFPMLLNQGDGTASVAAGDVFSGESALVIGPFQRYSHQISGWKFRIAENPGPDEFRYVRFAWKTRGGDGVMLELADNGRWPQPDVPTRRYFAGENTTEWQAIQVGSEVPEEWTIVTRDLWRDFGDFTLTGIAPTALGGDAMFDKIELLRTLEP